MGYVVSQESVETHLSTTLQILLAGKTYYAYDEGEGIPTTYTLTFNADLSSVTINQEDYPSGENPETRVVGISILNSHTVEFSGDEEITIIIEGSLSTIRLYNFVHKQLLDILYTTQAAAISAG